MPTYKVVVNFSGTKTYTVDADSPEEVEKMFEHYSSFDHYDNADDDCVSEDIQSIEEIETK